MSQKQKRNRSERKRLIAELDKLFSMYIRLRDKRITKGMCAFSCGNPIECCFHIITRVKYSVRWDERNAVASCSSCNLRMEYDPHRFISAYIGRVGLDAYEHLVRDSNVIHKWSNEDLRAKLDDFRGRIQAVCL